MARPTKLTPETHKAIVDALDIGATRADAVGAAGVEYQTFLNWLERGRKARKGIFVEFFESVRHAEHNARIKYTSVIAKAAKDGDWRAAMEYLKRRDRANWGDAVDLTTGGEKINEIVIRYADSDNAPETTPGTTEGETGTPQV